MSYIGVQPVPKVSRIVQDIIFTSDFTVIEPAAGYTVGNIELYIDGKLILPRNYTATNGTTIVLNSAYTVTGGEAEVRVVELRTFVMEAASGVTPLSITPETTNEINPSGHTHELEPTIEAGPISLVGINNGNDTTSGELWCSRVGNMVTLLISGLQHENTDNLVLAASAYVPEEYRPVGNPVENICNMTGARVLLWRVNLVGSMEIIYRDWNGNFVNANSIGSRDISISYIIKQV